MTAKELLRERIGAELARAGVDVEPLQGGALRLRGAFGNVILIRDLISLSPSELKRLTAWAS